MCLLCTVGYGSTGIVMPMSTSVSPAVNLSDYSSVQEVVASITLPDVEQPKWLKDQITAEEATKTRMAPETNSISPSGKIVVTYDVTNRGNVSTSLDEFRVQANQTLNDERGWARMGVVFQEVSNGGRFTLVLSEASQLPTFSSGCSVEYSCRAGRYVVINQDRWMGATASWNSAGGSLRDYRHMVINHETGHWLGHGHSGCAAPGQLAPVMQQQSIDLQACSFNPWPLASELSSSQLGIR